MSGSYQAHEMRKIYVAGHRGMVGGAILRRLQARKDAGEAIELITRTSSELDLTDQVAVRDFFQTEKPDVVILAAAKVGGIFANNTSPKNNNISRVNSWCATNQQTSSILIFF